MATFTVINVNDSGAGSLRQAVIDSNNRDGEDTIIFDDSLNGSTIALTSGEILISDDLKIFGSGADELTVDAGGNSRIFKIAGSNTSLFRETPGRSTDVLIQGLTITGGFSSSNGGAILAQETPSSNADLIISQSIITRNSANGNGAAIYHDGTSKGVEIQESVISENDAGGNGGAISSRNGEITIFGGLIRGNNAGGNGGGVESSGNISIIASVFQDNTAEGFGGGLYGARFLIINNFSTISNNRAKGSGGGIYAFGATVILDSTVSGNETDGSGGGISVANFLTDSFQNKAAFIANTTISGNKARGNGGGIRVVGLVNEFPGSGSGSLAIELWDPKLVATNVTIANNLADSDNDGVGNGGGISNFSSSLSENGLTLPGDITFENSIIADNFDTPGNDGTGFIAPDISGAARGNAHNLLGSDRGLTI